MDISKLVNKYELKTFPGALEAIIEKPGFTFYFDAGDGHVGYLYFSRALKKIITSVCSAPSSLTVAQAKKIIKKSKETK